MDCGSTIARVSYVVLYVVKIQGPLRGQLVISCHFTMHWERPPVFWLLRTQAEGSYGLAKLLSKRPRLKYKNGSKSVIYWSILMKFCMQLSNGHSLPLTKFQLGHKGQKASRPQGQRPKFQKVSGSSFNHNLGPQQWFPCNFRPKNCHCRRFGGFSPLCADLALIRRRIGSEFRIFCSLAIPLVCQYQA